MILEILCAADENGVFITQYGEVLGVQQCNDEHNQRFTRVYKVSIALSDSPVFLRVSYSDEQFRSMSVKTMVLEDSDCCYIADVIAAYVRDEYPEP